MRGGHHHLVGDACRLCRAHAEADAGEDVRVVALRDLIRRAVQRDGIERAARRDERATVGPREDIRCRRLRA